MDNQLSRTLTTLLHRGRAIQRRAAELSRRLRADPDPRTLDMLTDLCGRLLSGRGEASGVKLAQEIIRRYALLQPDERVRFFLHLARDHGPDWPRVEAAWADHDRQRSRASFQRIVRALEPPRQELFRRINLTPGGTAILLQMRTDLLPLIATHPELGLVDDDLVHLLRSWFNRGFLVMEQIDWSTSADLLERLIRYEAVHRIGDWDELRRRLLPTDRRCYAFFHPALAHDPLIFVEVALTRAIPDSIQQVLASEREILPADAATTAVFYSISNCQRGLQGISFGNFLIKQVVEELLRELPGLSTFVTLSPVPGFGKWLAANHPGNAAAALLDSRPMPVDEAARAAIPAELLPLAADYLLGAKDGRGRPLDPVARFHLGNGARLERLCAAADLSANGLAGGAGVMVNYLYDLKRVEANHEAFANEGRVIASDAVLRLRRMNRATAREGTNVA